MAHAGGRPTKYRDEFIQKVDEYLATCQDEQYQLVKTQGDKSMTWENKIKVKLPTLEGFATFIDFSVDALNDWEKEYPEFGGALNKIRRIQKEKLILSGLSGDYNSTIAKLVLSSNHGMRDGIDATTNGKDMPTPLLHVLRDNVGDKKDL